ncbi:MAG: hypothetical protein LC725_12235 [Lentisphaerae bacterium]|nr:hypothetical protein [Lentisphaerota bacterium]
MLQRKKFHAPLALTAGIFIILLALASALGLRFLFQLYARYMRSVADSSALQYGTVLAQPLLDEARRASAGMTPAELERLDRLARILHQADQRLEYVTLLEDGVVVFHWQAPPGARLPEPERAKDKVVVTPQVLHLGAHQVEVLDFRHELAPPDQPPACGGQPGLRRRGGRVGYP